MMLGRCDGGSSERRALVLTGATYTALLLAGTGGNPSGLEKEVLGKVEMLKTIGWESYGVERS